MDKAQQLLNFYQSQYFNTFLRLSKALEILGLDVFGFSLLLPSGDFLQLLNQAAQAEYYFSNGLYQFNPYIRHPDNFHHGQVIIPKFTENLKFNQIQEQVKIKTAVNDYFFSLYRKNGDIAYWFTFSTTNRINPISIYITHPQLINQFIDFFLEAWLPYQANTDPFYVNMHQLIGPSYHIIESPRKIHETQQKQKFLKRLGLVQELDFAIGHFTKREKECIDCLLQGNTASITAEYLGLSQRTVEHYIENIKNKLGCLSKAELIKTLAERRKLDLL